MKFRLIFKFYVLFFLVSTSAFGQVRDELTSPWITTPARYWLIGGLALTGTLLIFEDQIIDPAQQEATERDTLGDLAVLGDNGGRLVPNGIYALGMLSAYWMTGKPGPLRHGMVMLKASTYAVVTSTALKYIVREPRPKGDHLSFPSGHTTAASAFAAVVVAEHGLFPYGVPAIALASLTAFSRMHDNHHYLHDVVAGATIGTAFGLGVSYINSKNAEESPEKVSKWILIPHLDNPGVTVAYFF